MAKKEVVTLYEATPQLAAPQTGDTYQLCRDVYLTTGIIKSEIADGASAVGVVLDTENTFANAGSKLVSVRNAGTEKAYFDKDGKAFVSGVYAGTSGISFGYVWNSARPYIVASGQISGPHAQNISMSGGVNGSSQNEIIRFLADGTLSAAIQTLGGGGICFGRSD
jgi:hypothetical protein